MTNSPKTIGVLGGMGPQATIYFMQQIVNAVDAQDDANHVPLLVDQNPQVPSRIAAILEGQGADPAPVLIEMAQRLERAGAVALTMPCNTAHHYAAQISRSVTIPFLDMVDLAAQKAASLVGTGAVVGMLGSPALKRVGVFEKPLSDRELSAVYPEDEVAALRAIQDIKAQGLSSKTAHVLQNISMRMVNEGAQVICICCTEFSLHHSDLDLPVPVFDSLQCLVEATTAASLGGNPIVRDAVCA